MIICCCECVLSLKMHHEPIKMVCIEILSNYYSFMAQCYEYILQLPVWKSFINFDPNMLSCHCTNASKFLQYRKMNSLTLIEWVGLFQNFAFLPFFNPSFKYYCGFSSPLNDSILGFFEKIFKFGGLFSNSFILISSSDLLSYYLPR